MSRPRVASILLLTAMALLLGGVGIWRNVNIFWILYPDKTERQIWIDHWPELVMSYGLIIIAGCNLLMALRISEKKHG